MANQQIPLTSPIKGVVRSVPREGQPPETCWNAQNMLPFDRYGRRRLSQRAGIKQQSTTQMGSGTQMVQGLLEAPSIIYPPAAFSVPVDSISNLGVFPTSTPGTVGPVLNSKPAVAFSLEWQWTFNIGYTAIATWDGVTYPWGASTASCSNYLFFPLNGVGTSATSLILLLGAGSDLGVTPYAFGSSVSALMFVGVPANGRGTWTVVGTSTQVSNPGNSGDLSISQSVPCSLTINTTYGVTLILGSNSPVTANVGAWVNMPQLNLLSAEVDAFTPSSGVTNYVQTFNVTD